MSTEAAYRLPLAGRLHPWTLVFGLFAVARQMLIPLLYWVVSGFSVFGTLLVLMFGIPSLLLVVARYWTFRYRVEEGELIVEQGILRHQERHIPLANIQEIRLEQNLIQRQLGIARADIETSTGGGVEASLALLSVHDIARLRRCVFEHRGEGAPDGGTPRSEAPAVAEVPLVRLGWPELLIAGLTSNGIFTLFLILGALLRFAEEWLPEAGRRALLRGIEATVRALGGQSTAMMLATLFLSITFLVLLSVAASGVMAVVRFYDFQLTEQGTALRRTYGLLTRHISSLSPARIQLLAIEQTPLRRLFGWASLRVDVAGVAYERQEEQQGRGAGAADPPGGSRSPAGPVYARLRHGAGCVAQGVAAGGSARHPAAFGVAGGADGCGAVVVVMAVWTVAAAGGLAGHRAGELAGLPRPRLSSRCTLLVCAAGVGRPRRVCRSGQQHPGGGRGADPFRSAVGLGHAHPRHRRTDAGHHPGPPGCRSMCAGPAGGAAG